MTIQLDGVLVGTTMRTPGHDYELAVGFCHTRACSPARRCPACATAPTGRAVDERVQRRHRRDRRAGAGADAPPRAPPRRAAGCAAATRSTSCAAASRRCRRRAVDPARRCSPPCPTRCSAARGCSPPPARCTPRRRSTARAGAARARGRRPPQRRRQGGRAGCCSTAGCRRTVSACSSAAGPSFEMVQKAWAAGFAALVAVSAPTALAVARRRRAGLTLAGFVRGDRLQRLHARAHRRRLSAAG